MNVSPLALRLGEFWLNSFQIFTFVRFAVGTVLLAAAAAKYHQLMTVPPIGAGLLDSRWFLIATVEVELFFGIWLLANILPKLTWATAITCFGLFACVSLYKALLGNTSCGCFGRVSVNPWYAIIVDLVIVLALLRWPPKAPEPLFSFHFKVLPVQFRAVAMLVIWFSVGLPAGLAMASFTDTSFSHSVDITGNGEIVVLRPSSWIGKRFPLLDYIDIGDTLKDGSWLVLLYRNDCQHCREVIHNLHGLADESNLTRVALIELPPHDTSTKVLNVKGIELVQGRLSDAQEWFAHAPMVLVMSNGQVAEVINANTGLNRTGPVKGR